MEKQTDHSAFIEEQRAWLIEHKEQTGLSWSTLQQETRQSSRLSQFGSSRGYNGKKDDGELPIAQAVERYRQSLVQRAVLRSRVPTIPDFFPTETSDRLEYVLGFAQQGEMVAAALEAGCGKTTAAKHYRATYPNVFYVEVPKSASRPNNLIKLILHEMGEKKPVGGTFDLSRQACGVLSRVKRPLLILDEAQHLNEESLEEIRSWFDKEGLPLGVALFGNIGVLHKLDRYDQLFSRISLRFTSDKPTSKDIDALSDAWAIENSAIRAELQAICSQRGGLRSGTKALRLARMMSDNEGKELDVADLKAAWRQLDRQMVHAA